MWAVLLCTLSSLPPAYIKNTDEKVACDFFSLFYYFYLPVASTSWHPHPRAACPGPVAEKMVIMLRSFKTSLCHWDLLPVSALLPVRPYADFPPFSHLRLTNRMKCEQSRDGAIPNNGLLPSAPAIWRWTRQRSLSNRADNAAAN